MKQSMKKSTFKLSSILPPAPVLMQKYIDDYSSKLYVYIPDINNNIGWLHVPKKNSIWINKNREVLYRVKFVSNLNSEEGRYSDFPVMVTYEDTINGNIWTRPLCLFLAKNTPHNN